MNKKQDVSVLTLIMSFMKTGVLGFGGGPSVIPLIKHEAVERYHWLSEEKFNQTFSLANALPGPIATKMSAYIGYQVKGLLGLVAAVLAHILPSTIGIILLISMVNEFSSSSVVKGMISAVVPVVAVMLAVMTYEFMKNTWKGLGLLGAIIAFCTVLILMELIHIHSAYIILVFILLGMTFHKWNNLLRLHKRRD